ncbi:MAG: simple sugar transport system substrate-binding protein [Rhodobacteraceae bacterium]|nr:MAG: simple sugar transport system substrate-binding protein [Paracoccaceae bacterium]
MMKKILLATTMVAGLTGAALAEDEFTVAYLTPSLDISYWQWVGHGVKE